MPIVKTDCSAASEAQALSQIARDGFAAESKDYAAGRTEPHRHDYDICLHILAGEFRLGVPDEDALHGFGPGDRIFVPAGLLHFEDHGPLRMVVGRRTPGDGSDAHDAGARPRARAARLLVAQDIDKSEVISRSADSSD